MTYTQLAYFHLATVVPAFFLGAVQLLRRKGTPLHKLLGKTYMLLMSATGLITLAMPAEVGPRFLNHFGLIHIFSLLTLINVPIAYVAARRGDIRVHMLHTWLFG